MRVTSLTIANLKAIEAAEFRFQPGFNLIVGVNGVGKTSVLLALSKCLSATVKHANKLGTRVDSLSVDDIRIEADALTVECGIVIDSSDYSYVIHKPRDSVTPRDSSSIREQVYETRSRAEFMGPAPGAVSVGEGSSRPHAVLFSTRRAVPSERMPTKAVASGGPVAAFADAFADRELRLGEFAAWMRVQEALRSERPETERILQAFQGAVSRFLPGYSNLRVDGEKDAKLLIDRDGSCLEVKHLSDGERGTLALVLDLTRRLAQANPHLPDPAAKAESVVLIDEIDLHLHPTWQRRIVGNLTAAFPKCQFIATTHSPQVIGEVDPTRIQVLGNGEVWYPRHSFGADSSRVLEEIMDAAPRTESVQNVLTEFSRAVTSDEYETAKGLLAGLVEQVGEDDPEVTRARTLLEFMEDE
jgi:predicted ATP-binding protein involved in virulence